MTVFVTSLHRLLRRVPHLLLRRVPHLGGVCGLALLCSCAGSGGLPRRAVECAPYAREVTGLRLYGDAGSWWDQAAGRYRRASQPSPGSVLVFQATRRLPHGHVAVVKNVTSARSVMVTQANWVHHRVAGLEPVIDVSAANDWSLVRVWWAPAGRMGQTVYPTWGFVGPG